MKHIRTRYSPSPTGYLHIGGARTALFSYLFAKHNKGQFIFRLEDTDLKRNIADGEKSQLDNLIWLGIIPDESPINPNLLYGKYRQSEKLDRYNQIISELLKTGKAYKAYDTPSEILTQKEQQKKLGIFSFRYNPEWLKISQEEKHFRDQNGQYSIRIKLKNNHNYEWKDIVRGYINVNTNDIGDFVIRKQNGYPTYNFAVVVDDYDMKISHVLRGEEHITNTPKQLAIYDALNWTPPIFGHLTIVTNMEGKKLSKRDKDFKQFIEDYKNIGYPPEAVFNFLALLGWTDKDSLEIMTKKQLIDRFDETRFSKSPSKFDIEKMNWFAKMYFKTIDNKKIIKRLKIPIEKTSTWLEIFCNTYKKEVANFNQLQVILNSYINPKINKTKEKFDDVVNVFRDELNNINFTIENIKLTIEKVKQKTGKKGKELFLPIRKATTYKDHGPELPIDIWLTGEEIVKARLK